MDVEFVLRLLRDRMAQGGMSQAEAAQFLEAGFAASLVQEAVERHKASVSKVKLLKDPPAMVEPHEDWYAGPAEMDPCWPALKSYLVNRKHWPQDVVDTVDQASTRIVGLLAQPSQPRFAKRGLVLGYVQSGKTANFTAVISKAADAGYKLFIVLSGLHNGLRAQTQKRLEDELVRLNPKLWHTLTTVDADFEPHGNVAALLAEHTNQRVLCVMKKNGPRLRALLKWLSTGKGALAHCPMLMIDDEADQASVDTKGTDAPSVINKLILDILRSFPRSAYVAYTATPFANVLSDTSSRELLYPRDFIVDLPRPAAYFGAERIFGRLPLNQEDPPDNGLDMVRIVEADEEAQLHPPSAKERFSFEPQVTPSLAAAIEWFCLASAARRARGQQHQHMSMLVHTTVYTDVHERFGEALQQHLAVFKHRLAVPETRERLAKVWDTELERVPPAAFGEEPVPFEEVWRRLPEVLDDPKRGGVEVVVDNAQSESRLVFPTERGTTQIVVGGNTLSRGLTIEGLTVSFYLRTSGTYDTLLQMGRWFGYRAGYADLARIWTTAELTNAFSHLALVEQEIRRDVALYEELGATPADFGPKIRTHSALAITAPMKMRYAVEAEVSYSGDIKQTLYLDEKDGETLSGNLKAARTLLADAAKLVAPERVWDRHILFRGLNVSYILEFLQSYRVHERDRDIQNHLLVSYIQKQNDLRELLRWNVAVVGMKSASGETWTGLMPDGTAVPLLTRAKMRPKAEGDPAYLKAIMSQTDRAIDLLAEPPLPSEYGGDNGYTKEIAARRAPKGEAADPATGKHTPLLLLYPIDKDSKPQERGGKASDSRKPLAAVEHFVGLGLVFPRAQRYTPVTYMTADIRHLEPEPEQLEAVGEAEPTA